MLVQPSPFGGETIWSGTRGGISAAATLGGKATRDTGGTRKMPTAGRRQSLPAGRASTTHRPAPLTRRSSVLPRGEATTVLHCKLPFGL